MNGTTISGGATNLATVTDLNWRIAGSGDFDGDGKSDILWRHGATGEISIWFMNGATILSAPVFGAVTDLNWSITGGRELDEDAHSHSVWHNSRIDSSHHIILNGATIFGRPT